MTLVLTTSPAFGRHGRIPARLAGLGWTVVHADTPADFAASLPEADFVVVGLLPVTAAHLATAPRLKAVLKEISTNKVTSFPGVPTMFTALLAHPEIAKYDLSSLKFCGSGGAPLPLEVAQRFAAVSGCNLSEGWGMTETSPTGTFTPVHGKRKAGSCGLPMPRIEIRMLDLDRV